MKRNERTPDWEVVLEDASPLKLIVEEVKNVVKRVTLLVVKEGEQHFLKIETADAAYQSCILVRYHLDTVRVNASNPADEAQQECCVECDHVLSILSNLAHHMQLIIEAHGDKVIFKTKDPDNKSFDGQTQLDTYVDVDRDLDLFPMDFTMTLEIDLTLFRQMLKQATVAKAEQLTIRVLVQEKGGQRTLSLTHFSIEGDFQHQQRYCHEVTRGDDGSMVVRAATDSQCDMMDVEECTETYEGVFPIDKIQGFLKPLQCRMLTAKVKSGTPMMFEHRLGGMSDTDSYIRFLVAPINTE